MDPLGTEGLHERPVIAAAVIAVLDRELVERAV